MSNGDNGNQDSSHSLSLILSKSKTKLKLFTHSILYLPVILVTAVLLLFLLTSRLDELFFESIELNIPYLSSLIFAGSADAARSVLSTIAAGWATILGVAFSVTLITLQLSITKYTSHLVNRFEGDKLNQLTLGWFIGVVTYALLVLKTIRTSDSGGVEGFFTPLIGVNVAVIMAIISLFIFVLFLRNIASYLRPNMLIANVTNQILSSLRSYEKRAPDNQILFVKKKQYGGKLFEIRSRNEGVLSYLNWQSISRGLMDFSDHYNHITRNAAINNHGNDNPNSTSGDDINEEKGHLSNNSNGLWMQLSKSVGDSIRKKEVLAEIYSCTDRQNLSNSTDTSSIRTAQKPIGNNETQGCDNPNLHLKQDDINRYRNKILSGMEITPDRSYDKDPLFGIELLGTLAVKSAAMHDTDVVRSAIAGLFRVLIYTLTNEEKTGCLFVFSRTRLKSKGANFRLRRVQMLRIREDPLLSILRNNR